jgi:hypothetical protein
MCLAATLFSMDNRLWRAELLYSLLRKTAKDYERLPTIRQLSDLLRVWEAKLAISDFTNDVIGWASLNQFDFCDTKKGGLFMDEFCNEWYKNVPYKEDIQGLVHALSEFSRISEECSIHIRARKDLSAWTIAFVKWFTGLPPALDIGVLAAMSFTSRVSIKIQEVDGLCISIVQRVDGLDCMMHCDSESRARNKLAGLIDCLLDSKIGSRGFF